MEKAKQSAKKSTAGEAPRRKLAAKMLPMPAKKLASLKRLGKGGRNPWVAVNEDGSANRFNDIWARKALPPNVIDFCFAGKDHALTEEHA